MVQSGDAVGLFGAVCRLPGVEAEVVVITAGGDEQHVAGRAPARDIARLVDDVEAEDVDIERPHAVDVRGPQMDVSDPDQWIDRPVGGDDRIDRALRAAHNPVVDVAHRRNGSRRVSCGRDGAIGSLTNEITGGSHT